MRKTLIVLVLFVSASLVAADDPAPGTNTIRRSNKPKLNQDGQATLHVGDPAPKISAKWFQGEAVNSYGPGKVYVLEFWATWCVPCISAMPHLSELQDKYKSNGLTVVGVTSKDEDNTAEMVREFVAKNQRRMKYAVAFCETEETETAFLKSANQDSLPCSFVVDRAGKIAYIGHPLNLDEVLPKVLNGTWKGAEDNDALNKIVTEFFDILGKSRKDPVAAFQGLADFDRRSPSRKSWMLDQRFLLAVNANQWDDAKSMMDRLVSTATAQNDSLNLRWVSAILASEKTNPHKKHLDVAIKAAEAALRIEGDKDTQSLFTAAEAYFAAGQKAKAIEFGEKAVKSTDNKDYKKFLEERIKAYRG